ncbi:MAG: Holliday junction branch migration protein RuvA [Planctomycetota bacterium]
MIARIEGQIVEVRDATLLLRTAGGFTFEVLIPAADEYRWQQSVGETAELFTLPFFEAPGQGTTLIPRLVGFASAADRDFFLLFTRTRGIGYRKALRAMVAPAAQIATAIAGRDISWLKTLPEIGKRTAESIVAELHGRINDFLLTAGEDLNASAAAADAAAGDADSAASDTASTAASSRKKGNGTTRGAARGSAKKSRGAMGGTPATTAAPVALQAPAATGAMRPASDAPAAGPARGSGAGSRYNDARDAVVALVKMGENRPTAQALMDRVLTEFPDASGPEELITIALRLRAQS